MKFLRSTLTPVYVTIRSSEVNGQGAITTEFRVMFEIPNMFSVSKIQFETVGKMTTPEPVDEETLMKILRTTDHDEYVKANMRDRDKGKFDFRYRYKEQDLLINFSTF